MFCNKVPIIFPIPSLSTKYMGGGWQNEQASSSCGFGEGMRYKEAFQLNGSKEGLGDFIKNIYI